MTIEGFIWEPSIVQAFLQQAQTFGYNLLDRDARYEVFLDATIDFWTKKSKPYLKILGLNAIGMKGLRQQQRDATIAALTRDGLLERNKALPWPTPGLRICCIAKQDSDGCRDTLTILAQSPYAFQITVQNVAVQGINAIPTILQAFHWVQTHAHLVDVVVLCRGGGSESDLMAFDDETLARAVATCPRPVITGLGHTADRSICDLVSAESYATPTAAARGLVDRLTTLHTQCVQSRALIHQAAHHLVQQRRTRLLVRRPKLLRHAVTLLHRSHIQQTARWHRLTKSLQEQLHRHHTSLRRTVSPLRLYAARLIAQQRTRLQRTRHTTVLRAPAVLTAKRTQLMVWRRTLPLMTLTRLVTPTQTRRQTLTQRIQQGSRTLLQRAHQQLHQRHVAIQALSPDRYFALGLSYVTDRHGQLVRAISDVSPRTILHIHLKDGILPATAKKGIPHED